ncbi:ABC transporter substrate-binding protein [Solwaraspora sp. WMMB335]|uniref:ABC transporter substrate-binding protein n=1 Tax=Solwaraspora sp. WMMB335 TaxID=3404118 RepID=UPI003B96364C
MTISARPRRGIALSGALLSATLLLAGCSGSSGPGETQDTKGKGPGAGTYPVTIDTAYGEITLKERPERIVALGRQSNYVDMLAAIGVEPVAFAVDGAPDEAALLASYPWFEGLTTAEFDPKMITAEQKAWPEAIAEHDPDLILGDIWGIDEQLYGQLSQIAPAYVGVDKDAVTGWKDHLTALGALTGHPDEASQVVSDIEGQLSTARDRLSGLQGKTYNFGVVLEGMFRFGGATFPDDLGLVPAENQGTPTGTTHESLSLENLDQLQADVLLIGVFADPDARSGLEADPRFAELPASKNGTVVFIDRQLANASGSTPGPASLAWLLERVVPQLAASRLNGSGR